MSPLDVPLALALIGSAVGCGIGFGLFVAACLVIERWRR